MLRSATILWQLSLSGGLLFAGLVGGTSAYAQDTQEAAPVIDDAQRAPAGAGMAHAYTGAHDEQRLEVQTTLPAPSRSVDGLSLPASDEDDDAPPPPATAPASD